MFFSRAFCVLLCATALGGCATLRQAAGTPGRGAARIFDTVNNQVGTATLTDTPNGLLISATVTGLGLGGHAVHIHQAGKCEAPFTSAGLHYNPDSRLHGFKNDNGPHAGDMPNIVTPPAGQYSFEMVVSRVKLGALLDGDGAALVFHAAADDYLTDPAGDSGARIACGVIVRR